MIKEPVCFDPRRRLAALVAAAVFSLTALSPMSLQAQAERSPYHVSRYNIEVELEPDVHQLRVRARLTVVADEPLASLNLFLNKNLRVEQVLDRAGKELPFERAPQAESFRIDLPERVPAGQSVELVVAYVGAFDPALRPERGPQLAAIDSKGSYLLPEARWFPQSVNVWDRYAMTLSVTVSGDQIALSSGKLEPCRAIPAGKTLCVVRADQPTLTGTLVAGPFVKVSPPPGAPLTFYLRTVRETEASANAETLADIIAFFSDKFGPLENPELAVVET